MLPLESKMTLLIIFNWFPTPLFHLGSINCVWCPWKRLGLAVTPRRGCFSTTQEKARNACESHAHSQGMLGIYYAWGRSPPCAPISCSHPSEWTVETLQSRGHACVSSLRTAWGTRHSFRQCLHDRWSPDWFFFFFFWIRRCPLPSQLPDVEQDLAPEVWLTSERTLLELVYCRGWMVLVQLPRCSIADCASVRLFGNISAIKQEKVVQHRCLFHPQDVFALQALTCFLLKMYSMSALSVQLRWSVCFAAVKGFSSNQITRAHL